MHCKHCGKKLKGHEKFCMKCGALVEAETADKPNLWKKLSRLPKKNLMIIFGIVAGLVIIAATITTVLIVKNNAWVNGQLVLYRQEYQFYYDKFAGISMAESKRQEANGLLGEFMSAVKEEELDLCALKLDELIALSDQIDEEIRLSKEQEEKRLKEEARQQALADAKDKYAFFENALLELVPDMVQQATYYDKLSKLEAVILEENVEQCTLQIKELTDFVSLIKEDSKKRVEEQTALLLQTAPQGATTLELERIDAFKEEAARLVSLELYASASALLQEWDALSKAIAKGNTYSLAVTRTDLNGLPNIKLYFQMKELSTDRHLELNDSRNLTLMEKKKDGTGYEKKEILRVDKLDIEAGVGICMAVDISGSGTTDFTKGGGTTEFDLLKDMLHQYLEQVRFSKADQVSFLSFSNNISVDVDFTTHQKDVADRIDSVERGNLTAFYDALYAAVGKASERDGIKCAVVFTDGLDNDSSKTSEDVILLATKLNVPIFLIGIGDKIDETGLANLADSTGGFYKNASEGIFMDQIYDKLEQNNKNTYVLEYQSDITSNDPSEQLLLLAYEEENVYARCEYSFVPAKVSLKEYTGSGMYRYGMGNMELEQEKKRIDELTAQYDSKIMGEDDSFKKIVWEPEDYIDHQFEVTAEAYLDQSVKVIKIRHDLYGMYFYFEDEKLIKYDYSYDGGSASYYFTEDQLFLSKDWLIDVFIESKYNDSLDDKEIYEEIMETTLKEAYRLLEEAKTHE